jgi:hypothetical protein
MARLKIFPILKIQRYPFVVNVTETKLLKPKKSIMKRSKIVIIAALIITVITGGIIFAADHLDAPSVSNQTTDITDLYAFQGADPNALDFVANTQGFLSPTATSTAKFDENTLLEINIDNNNDNIEDLVIQCKYDATSNTMKVYGPVAPSEKGTRSKLEGSVMASVAVTPYGSAPISATQNGIMVFAGPRDDPFFFDLDQYKKIIAGTATSFNNPGTDTFAGTNVMSVVLEVQKSLLGSTGKINVWLETKKKI